MKNVVISVEVPLEVLSAFVKHCEKHKLVMKTANFTAGGPGPRKKKKFLTEAEKTQIVQAYEKGATVEELVQKYGGVATTVRRVLLKAS